MRFRERIEIWQTNIVGDGFGGGVSGDGVKIAESWANVKTMGINSKYSKVNSPEGVNPSSNGIVVTVRKRNDITYNNVNQFIKHKGVSYQIQSMPINVDFNNKIIEFVAVRDEVGSVSELDPMT